MPHILDLYVWFLLLSFQLFLYSLILPVNLPKSSILIWWWVKYLGKHMSQMVLCAIHCIRASPTSQEEKASNSKMMLFPIQHITSLYPSLWTLLLGTAINTKGQPKSKMCNGQILFYFILFFYWENSYKCLVNERSVPVYIVYHCTTNDLHSKIIWYSVATEFWQTV